MPYIHGSTHKLKMNAGIQYIHVVCSAPNKTYSMPRGVSQSTHQMKTCGTSHRTRYVQCQTWVVCCFLSISFACGKYYIGQTDRCINDRIKKHAAPVRGASAGHLSAQCKTWKCSIQQHHQSCNKQVSFCTWGARGTGRSKNTRRNVSTSSKKNSICDVPCPANSQEEWTTVDLIISLCNYNFKLIVILLIKAFGEYDYKYETAY